MGADPDTEEGFVRWVNSIRLVFAETSLGTRLIAEGFERVHDAHLVTAELLRDDFDFKAGQAAAFVEAARAVQASLEP